MDDDPHLNTWRPVLLASDDFPHVRQAALVMGDALGPAHQVYSFADWVMPRRCYGLCQLAATILGELVHDQEGLAEFIQ